jgi:fructokinase
MDDRWVQTDPDHPTGTVQVTLAGGSPSYAILPDQAYDFLGEEAIPAEASVIYHGTLALRSAGPRRALDALCSSTGAPVFVDVNLRDPWWSAETVRAWLDRARWAKLNDEELEALGDGAGSLPERAARFRDRFGLEALFVTRGERGSLLRTREGRTHEVVPEPAAEIVDTVGAGDAFTAVVLYGLVEGWPPETTQRRAQEFATALVGIRGGTCRDHEFYEPFRTRWRSP